MRAAIYARYSSELQNPTSIDDQLRACRERAAREGWTIVGEYADAATSGSINADNRPQLRQLLGDAERGCFDIVLTEALDRISRDMEHSTGIFKRLTYWKVQLKTLVDGEINKMLVGLRSIVADLFLDDLKHKTRRGLVGRLNAGRMPGGLCYGYRCVDGQAGLFEIDPDQAAVVKRIFADYVVEGKSPRQIIKDLNRDSIPGPRGDKWSTSTINGSQQRANGIIGNRLYIGEAIFGRQRNVKDPNTGRMQKRPVPEAEWIRQPMPHLAVVDRAIFDAAQKLRKSRCQMKLPQRRRPRHLLSGLIECGACGANMIIASQGRLTCSAHANKAACDNHRTIKTTEIETRVLDALQERLLAPEIVSQAVEAYRLEREKAANDRARARREAERELAAIKRKIAGLITLIEDGAPDARALVGRIVELERQEDAIKATAPREVEDDVLAVHQRAAERYGQLCGQLREALTDPSAKPEAMALLRELISRIVVEPTPKGKMALRIEGDLAVMLDREQARNRVPVVMVPPSRIERETSRSTI